MTDSAHSDAPARGKRRRSVPARIIRTFAITGAVCVFVLALLVVFTETSWFRSLARDLIIEAADSALTAKLDIGDIDGNIFSGWKIDRVRLTAPSGPILRAQSVVIRYNLFSIPYKSLDILEVALNAPEIFLTKAAGRDWNIATLLRDTTSSPSSGPFTWRVLLRNVRIVDGRLTVFDSTTAAAPDAFDPTHLRLDSIALTLSADYSPTDKKLSLNECRFVNRDGLFSLIAMTGDFRINARRNEVDKLAIRTRHSSLLLSASLDSLDVLKPFRFADLATKPVDVRVFTPAMDLRDIHYFLPSLRFLGGAPSLSLKTSGSLKRLSIRELELRHFETVIAFTGEIRDIDAGADLFIDVSSDNTAIVTTDVPILMPGIPLPDYSEAGTVRFSSLSFRGRPLDFEAKMHMESDAGNAEGTAGMDMTGGEITYAYDIRGSNVNVAKILRQPLFNSSLNFRARMEGSGFSPGRMTATADLVMDTSRYQRYRADHLTLSMRARPDSLIVVLAGELEQSRISADAALALAGDSVTGFRALIGARKLDVGKALNLDSLDSDLSFACTAGGNGMSLSDASLQARVVLSPSRIRDLSFEADTVSLSLDQHDRSARRFTLSSRFVDASLSGAFDIPRLATMTAVLGDSIVAGLDTFRLSPRQDVAAVPQPHKSARGHAAVRAAAPLRAAMDTSAFLNARFSIRLKRPPGTRSWLGRDDIYAIGDVDGTVSGGAGALAMTASLDHGEAAFVDSSGVRVFSGLRCSLDIAHLSAFHTMSTLRVDASAEAGQVQLGGMTLRNLGLRTRFADMRPTFELHGALDTMFTADIAGSADLRSRSWSAEFPRVAVSYRGIEWKNAEPVRVRMADSSMHLDAFVLSRADARISISGSRTFGGTNAFRLGVTGLRVAEIDYMASGNRLGLEGKGFSGDVSIDADIAGTDDAPLLSVDAFIPTLGYQRSTFGEFHLEARYEPQMLELYSELNYPLPDGSKRKVFFASGSLPVSISFGGNRRMDVAGSASLRLRMSDFPLTLTEKFIGLFSPLDGSANADITVRGTAQHPQYAGFLSIADARGRFRFNNMTYRISMRLEPNEQRIQVREFSIRNDPADWPSGLLTASGSIETSGFRISRFDLEFDGRLKILRNESRSALRSVYGDLYIATRNKPLSYSGRIEKSLFVGALDIVDGNLTYSTQGQPASVKSFSNIRYVDVKDRRDTTASPASEARKEWLEQLQGAQTEQNGDESQRPPGSLLDGLTYDITVSTEGGLRIIMPFSTLSQEELNARLKIDALKVTNWLGSGKFTGEVALGPDSYYIQFGKRFLASGSLIFVGEPQNPDLRLRAVYSDYHTDKATGERRRVYVIITITGTRTKPELAWDMRWDSPDSQQRPRAGDVQSDAFSFILLGLFTDELTGSDRGRIVDQADAIGNAMTSSILSSAASEFIQKAGLQSVFRRIELGGIGTQDARIKVTSEIGRALVTYDGKINNLGSSDVSFEIPMNMFFPNFGFGNMVIQATRRTSNSALETGTAAQETAVYELKLLYRFSF